jgi:hypothetical protein
MVRLFFTVFYQSPESVTALAAVEAWQIERGCLKLETGKEGIKRPAHILKIYLQRTEPLNVLTAGRVDIGDPGCCLQCYEKIQVSIKFAERKVSIFVPSDADCCRHMK